MQLVAYIFPLFLPVIKHLLCLYLTFTHLWMFYLKYAHMWIPPAITLCVNKSVSCLDPRQEVHLDALRFLLKLISHFSCCFTDSHPPREVGTKLHTTVQSSHLFQKFPTHGFLQQDTITCYSGTVREILKRDCFASQMTKPPAGQQQFIYWGDTYNWNRIKADGENLTPAENVLCIGIVSS